MRITLGREFWNQTTAIITFKKKSINQCYEYVRGLQNVNEKIKVLAASREIVQDHSESQISFCAPQ